MVLLLMNKPNFFVDAMLGNVAKKLRILGYDTHYSSSIDDKQIIKEALDEHRIIITKDQTLAKSAKKSKLDVVLLITANDTEQFLEIAKKLNIKKILLDSNLARCSLCNGNLESVTKDTIIELIPDGVAKKNSEYWQCKSCKKIYWKGTHYDNIQKFVDELNEKL